MCHHQRFNEERRQCSNDNNNQQQQAALAGAALVDGRCQNDLPMVDAICKSRLQLVQERATNASSPDTSHGWR